MKNQLDTPTLIIVILAILAIIGISIIIFQVYPSGSIGYFFVLVYTWICAFLATSFSIVQLIIKQRRLK
ncbi:hypothetical protein B0O44_11287 [Pedobacter nutrimenti]|uniref:Uncharacterized protein n=1 Tax=Pedobacter nutrimenti TaxID=1241337 RepID=A0A318U6M4_9SPHI|nr:hypothetical protein B0O44_11287 [Pedobacter nutrimenti]